MADDPYSTSDEVAPKKDVLTLINKIPGITRLSPRVKIMLLVGVLFLLMLLMFALDGMDSKDKVKVAEEEKVVGVEAANVPLSALEQPDVNPKKAALAESVDEGGDEGEGGSGGPAVLIGKDGKPLAGKGVGDDDDVVVTKKDGYTITIPKLRNDEGGGGRGGGGRGDGSFAREQAARAEESRNRLREQEEQRLMEVRRQAVAGGAAVSGFADTDGGLPPPRPPGRANMMPPQEGGGGGAGGRVAGQGGGQEDQNKQGRKEQFLAAAAGDRDDGYLTSLQRPPISMFELKAGSVIPCVLQAAINSDLPGLVRGLVSEDVHDSRKVRYLLIPKGTQTIGTYDSQVAFGQKRLLVVWSKLIFPDGSTMMLQGMPGADQSGAAGMVGEVDNHWWGIFGAAIATSVITAGAQLSQGPPPAQGAQPTVNQAMAASLGNELGQVGMAITKKNMGVQPTIETFAGARFYINVTKDMVFQMAYGGS